jgi:hypothetical protein
MRMSTVVALGILSALAWTSGTTRTSSAGSMPEQRAPMLVPKPNHEALRAGIYAAFPRAEGRWGAVHVVDRTCSVSRDVIVHLIDRRASAVLDELVVVIDRDGATTRDDVELVHAGYRVRIVAHARASEVVSIGMPAMIVARPDGTLAYVGGHRHAGTGVAGTRDATGTRPNRAVEKDDGFVDVTIASELVEDGTTDVAAPVIGCSEPTRYTARTMQ